MKTMKFLALACLTAGLAVAQSSYLGIGLLQSPNGIEVTKVTAGSPAAAAGLKEGDVITSFNGQPVSSNEQFILLVRQTLPGRQVRLGILRGGAAQTVTARIGIITDTTQSGGVPGVAVPRIPDELQSFPGWRSPILGVEAEELQGKQLAEYFGVTEGVLVRSVAAGSAAEKAGIKAGDVITGVGSTKVALPVDITNRLRIMTGKSVPVTLLRRNQPMTLNVTFE